jgi:hypothetical protein
MEKTMKENSLPKLGIHVDINSWTIDRVQESGHPRLLKVLLSNKHVSVFSNVTITSLQINGKEVVVK